MQLTVGMATWNRARLLSKTLAALAALRVPAGVTWRVLVCDNNSTDDTKAIVAAASAALRDKVEVRYLFEPTQGKSHALNRILAEARGDWLLLLDDDVLVDAGWMEGYLAGIARHPRAGCLGGAILPWLEKPVTGRRAFLLREYPYVYGITPIMTDTPMRPPQVCAWGANMALKRTAIPAEGFSLERGMIGPTRIAGEDVGIQSQMLAGGAEGWLLSDAAVKHFVPYKLLGSRRFCQWQQGMGRTWVLTRGTATPGKFGVPWWAWKELARRSLRVAMRWRPWPNHAYYDALKDAAQYLGYLRASR